MRLRSRVAMALGGVGLYALSLAATAAHPRVLMYHRFSQVRSAARTHASEFERQLRILRREFRVVSLGEYGHWVGEGRPIPSRTAVITVDDGYRDFYTVAYPLLRKYGLPATLFVATDAVEHGSWLWPDSVEWILAHSSSSRVRLDQFGAQLDLQLGGDLALRSAWSRVIRVALTLDSESRARLIRSLADACRVNLPQKAAEAFRVCSWDELREMSEGGVEIGGHTKSHPVVSRLHGSDLEEEISGCKRVIEERTGKSVTSFCYPNGMPSDISQEAKYVVARSGFRCAVSAYVTYRDGDDPYEIERLAVGDSPRYFNEAIFGIDRLRARWRARSSSAARAMGVP